MVRPDARQFYTILADERVRALARESRAPGAPLWLNLGYWENATTFPDACAALARLLGEVAGLRRGDAVLDVGCGFAEPTLYWAETFGLRRIVGINNTPLQIAIGRALVHARELQGRVSLSLASATCLPFRDGTFDKVMALECAFHFDTREAFLAEARRVLRPGGRIAVADMLPMPGRRWFAAGQALRRRIIAVPAANMYDRTVYARKLEASGFADVSVRSIREHVYPPFARCLRIAIESHTEIERAVVPMHDAGRRDEAGAAIWERYGLSDYVVAAATRC
jgi:microcystin synthetase protein McyJ